MAKRIRLKKNVKILLGFILLFIIIALVEAGIQNRSLGQINISIDNQRDNYFLDSLEVLRLLTNNHREDLSKMNYRQISIKTLESRVRSNLFVQDCEIARNLNGDLFVDVVLSRPIARFSRVRKPDFYIDSLGKVMLMRENFTARVLLVTRQDRSQLPDFKKRDKRLLEVLNYIDDDSFLKAQIAHVDIHENGEITLFTQVGDHEVVFGAIDNFRDKFKRFKIFYKELLPLQGWNAYKKFNLKYENQIICE